MIMYVSTQSGPDKKVNEDSTLMDGQVINCGNYCKICNESSFISGIADGVGGHLGADIASNFVLKSLDEQFEMHYFDKELYDQESVMDDFRSIILRINEKLIEYASKIEGKEKMATTLSGIVSIDSRQYVYHTGNTRIIYYNQDGIHLLTSDHTTMNYLIQIGEITKEEAKLFNRKGEIISCMGAGDLNMANMLQIYEITDIFNKNNLIIMTTDGIHDFVSKNELEECINRNLKKCLMIFKTGIFEDENNVEMYDDTFDTVIECLEKTAAEMMLQARINGSGDDTSILMLYR